MVVGCSESILKIKIFFVFIKKSEIFLGFYIKEEIKLERKEF